MPLWPCSVVISAKRKTTSVMGFWRPVNTFASLIGTATNSGGLALLYESLLSSDTL